MIKSFTSKLLACFWWWLRSCLPFNKAVRIQIYERNGTEDHAFHLVKRFFAKAAEKTSQPRAKGSKFWVIKTALALCVRRKSNNCSVLRITCSSPITLRHQFSTNRNFWGREGKSMRMSEIVLYILHVWIKYLWEVTSHLFSITFAKPCLSACGQKSNKTHF